MKGKANQNGYLVGIDMELADARLLL